MANGDVAADDGGMTVLVIPLRSLVLGDVEQGKILDVGSGPDADAVDIAPDNDAEPEGHILTQDRIANQSGTGSHPPAFADLRLIITVRQYHLSLLLFKIVVLEQRAG